MNELKNKIVIVTGSLGSLGKEIVLRFVQEGAIVAACFRGSVDRFNKLYPEDKNVIHPYSVDLSDYDSVIESVQKISEELGSIDILINCAGITYNSPFMITGDEKWSNILDTNIGSVQRMCSAVAPSMMVRKCGSIVNISSIIGETMGRGSAAYATSKAAINRFTEVAADELGRKGIRVNAVAPGLLEGGMADSMMPQAVEHSLSRTPLKRKGKLSEVVEAVLFLASERASYITGHILNVDGGASCE